MNLQMLKLISQQETPLKSFYGLLKFISRNIRSLSALKPRSLIAVLCWSKVYRNFKFYVTGVGKCAKRSSPDERGDGWVGRGKRQEPGFSLPLSFLQSAFLIDFGRGRGVLEARLGCIFDLHVKHLFAHPWLFCDDIFISSFVIFSPFAFESNSLWVLFQDIWDGMGKRWSAFNFLTM